MVNQGKNEVRLIVEQRCPVRYMGIVEVASHLLPPCDSGAARVDVVFESAWAITQGTEGPVLLRVEEVEE